MKSIALPFLFICTGLVCAGDLANEEDFVEVPIPGTYAIPLSQSPASYPARASVDEVEGWVVVMFIVNKDGSTADIEVHKTSIEGYFDAAAIEAVSRWTYRPATLQGKPVIQGNKFARLVFQFEHSEGGVTRTFLGVYKKARKAIEDGDLELAQSLIEELDANGKRLLAEVCYLDMLKRNYFAKKGDTKAALLHVERALVIADNVATNDVYVNLLKHAVLDNGMSRNYQTSLAHYNKLVDIDENLSPDDPVHAVAARVREILKGDEDIHTDGEISVSCTDCEDPIASWRRVLNRARFKIDQVVGEVSELEILCRNSTISFTYNPDKIWNVDMGWGDCSLRVFGEEGTTFRLVEYQGVN